MRVRIRRVAKTLELRRHIFPRSSRCRRRPGLFMLPNDNGDGEDDNDHNGEGEGNNDDNDDGEIDDDNNDDD